MVVLKFSLLLCDNTTNNINNVTGLAKFNLKEGHIIRYGLTWGQHLCMNGREAERASRCLHTKYSGGTLCNCLNFYPED
jgi:hypothetical protein